MIVTGHGWETIQVQTGRMKDNCAATLHNVQSFEPTKPRHYYFYPYLY